MEEKGGKRGGKFYILDPPQFSDEESVLDITAVDVNIAVNGT